MIIRAWNYNLQDITLENLIWQGCSLNLLLFSLSFFIFYKLLQLIIPEKHIPIALFLAFINTASISTTLLIREYQLQGLGFLIVTYIFTKTYLWIKNNKNLKILSFKNIFFYAIALAFFALTGYYALIYETFLALTFLSIIYKYVKFNKELILKIFFLICLTILVILIIDPNYGKDMYVEYLNAPVQNLSSIFLFRERMFFIFDNFIKILYYPIIILFLIILSLTGNYKKKENIPLLCIFLLAFLWCIVILIIAPHKSIRYVIPAAPILSLILLYFIQGFKFKHALTTCFILFFLAFFASTKVSDNSYFRPLLLYVHDNENFVFKNISQMPIVFKKYNWTLGNFIIYSNDNQIIEFINYIPDKNFKYKEYILFYNVTMNENDFNLILEKGNKVIIGGFTSLNDFYCIIDNRKK